MMSIWTYCESKDKRAIEQIVQSRPQLCEFCHVSMLCSHQCEPFDDIERRTERYVHFCPACGWWMVRKDAHGRDNAGAYAFTNVSGAIGTLKELEVLDSSHTVDEIRHYLTVRYERRQEVNPAVFEQVVASVYRDVGYRNVRVTGRSNDGGIDIVMEGPNDSLVGVQVKRYEDKIGAEQIRGFTGALVLNHMTAGIFVTTSDYTRGAKSTAAVAGHEGYRIELVDAYAFYDSLGIAQRALYSGATDRTAPFPSAHMHHVSYKKVYLSGGKW